MEDQTVYSFLGPKLQNKLCFDIGSNIGKITKLLASYDADVISVEPITELTNGENYKYAKAIENVCVGDKICDIKFYQCKNSSAISTCLPLWREGLYKPKEDQELSKFWADGVKKPCVTLDWLIGKYGTPEYIKIDVEGFENRVFKGLSKKVKYISYEYTGGYGDIFKAVLKKVKKLGYNKFTIFEVNKVDNKANHRIEVFDSPNDFMRYYEGLEKFKQGDVLIE